MHARWRAMTAVERLNHMLEWMHQLNLLRYNAIRARNPGAEEGELLALWSEETHRGTVDAGFLARACDAIRARGGNSP